MYLCTGCSQWTNSACESMNHVFKQRQQWRRHMLPDLVDNLRTLIASQYAEADRAICGRGNFILRPTHRKHLEGATGRRCQSRSGRASGTLCSRCHATALLGHSSPPLLTVTSPSCIVPMPGRNWAVVVDLWPTARRHKRRSRSFDYFLIL